jgi:hypothetical protein
MKIIRWMLSILFMGLIIIELYLTLFKQLPLNKLSIMLLLLLIAVFQFRNKLVWYISMTIFIYGIYSLSISAIYSAEPVTMQFTSRLSYLLFEGNSESKIKIFIEVIPDYFYSIFLILFLTKKFRRYYGVLKYDK